MDIMELDFDQWLEIGVRSGWVSPPVCYTHDGLPTSVTEDAEFEDGSDPCVHIMRCYESQAHKEAIELNYSPAIWRNNFTVMKNCNGSEILLEAHSLINR
jgi:hypothetical protein